MRVPFVNILTRIIGLRHQTCSVDTPALLDLDTPYFIDTVMCTLLVVALIHINTTTSAMGAFDGPPTTARGKSDDTRPEQSKASRKWYVQGICLPVDRALADTLFCRYKRHRSDRQRPREMLDFADRSEVVELPVLTRGILGVLGFTFRTIVWLLATGVKLTASLVVAISHLAFKA